MTPELRATQTVGTIVARDSRTATVFSRHGIDFCCGGQQTLQQACASKRLDVSAVIEELQESQTAGTADSIDVTGWSADELVDWIITRHHAYVRAEIPLITGLLAKAVRRHGESHHELAEISARFSTVADDLLRHMEKEEQVVFPMIEWLDVRCRSVSHQRGFAVEHPIAAMRAEHDDAARDLADIRDLANGYSAPLDACGTWRAAYTQLEAFEADLHRHVHLENEVLFPLAVRLVADRAEQAA